MITLEKVDQLRKRTNCSYEEAKALLEKHNGDVLEAIVEFEKEKSRKKHHFTDEQHWKKEGRRFGQTILELIRKGFENRVVIEDKNGVLLNISVNIMLLILIIPAFTIPALLIILLLMLIGYKISIRKGKGNEMNLSSMVKEVTDRFTGKEQPESPQEKGPEENDEKDDYNEINIE